MRVLADTEEDVEESLVTAMDECSSLYSSSNDSLKLVLLVLVFRFVVDLNTVLLALFSVLRVVSIYVEAAKKIGPILFRLEFPVG